ncbi:Ig-like domain-containing protein [Candidatus Saganbacteria bacterium]|nr:Ig-like domain-containing protein [Candidatus Saganbacteria bacterium]
MQTGYYVGSGVSRSITGVGFQPDLVIIKADTATGRAVWRSSSMTGDSTAYFENAAANASGLVTSLDSDGFSLGTGADVNSVSNTRYVWIAFRSSTGVNLKIGSYTGNGSDDRNITGVGFQPNLVWTKRDGAYLGVWYTSSMGADNSHYFSATAPAADRIQALQADGFQVGANAEVNSTGATYYYVAFKTSESMSVESYTGDGTDNRSISKTAFKPDFVFVKQSAAASAAVLRSNQNYGDESQIFTATANAVDHIQTLEAAGFQVGTNARVNAAASTYYFAAFRGVTSTAPTNTFTMSSGSYLGNGTSMSITSVGFRPDLVIVKSDTAAGYGVFATSKMTPDSTAYLANAAANFSDGITSLTGTGFNIGANAAVNTVGITYRWTAFGNSGSTNFVVGSYTGTSTGVGVGDNRSIPALDFTPDIVAIKRDGASLGVFRTASIAGDNTAYFSVTADTADVIQALETTGFQVGTNAQANTAANLYHYFAFKATTDQFKESTYVGNATDNRNITGVGFIPGLLLIKRPEGTANTNAVFRNSSLSGDNAQYFTNTANASDLIQALQSDGFQIGSGAAAGLATNANGITYRYAAWASAPASKVAYSVQPSTTEAGVTMSPSVSVEVQDQYGNLLASDNTTSVSLAIGTNPGSGTLSGTTSKTVSSGVASFSNLSINNAGNGYTLVASATGLTSATSNTFNITAEATPTITSVSPADLAVGVATSETVRVTFSETMNQSSVENALRLKAIRDKDGNTLNTQIDGTYSWSGTTVTFTPTSNLTKNYTYQATVSTEAADLVGDHLATTFSASFETILDHTASLTVIADDGKTKVVIPANAYNQDFYVRISTNPESDPIVVTPANITAATTKIAGEGNTFRHPISGDVREFVVYNTSGTRITDQLQSDATIYLPYRDDNNDGYVDNVTPPARVSALLNYRLNETSQLWVRVPGCVVDTSTKLVSAPVKSFSTFTAMATPANDLSIAYAYPNPFKPNSGLGHTTITFTNLASQCTIKIFTVSGDAVKTINESDGDGQNAWDVKNDAGENVVSGLYFYAIKSATDQKLGKLVIIR